MAFEEFIWQHRIKLSFEENQKLSIDWILYKGSYAMVACGNKTTAMWVKNLINSFTFEEKITSAYFAWERSEAKVFSVFLQGSLWRKKSFKANWVLGNILTQNGLRGEFRNVTYLI